MASWLWRTTLEPGTARNTRPEMARWSPSVTVRTVRSAWCPTSAVRSRTSFTGASGDAVGAAMAVLLVGTYVTVTCRE